ncbi:MAG: Hsp70 family protein [Deltaproteobacteria bacterium]|nr:Hsp70 family protein [Deltaproteobacteria bacterium]
MSKIIGIDLGTTNSCAAIVENGGVKLIPYKGGEFIIPSIFAIDDKGNELIGHEAKRQWQLNPRNTVYASKRLIGRSFASDVVELMQSTVAYKMKPGERNDVLLDVGTKNFRLAEVSAKILNKIRGVAQDYLQEKVTRAVVTVPAYFTDRQRQAVKDAGKMIQLEVVRIINEPTAAALAYGIGKNLNETVVIYDLGGGTFDVSIIEIRDRVFEVKATGGDIFLGGLDFDQTMIDYVLRDFASKYGIDLATDPVAMQRIKDLAERTKIDLSARESAPFSVPFVTMTPQGQPLNIDFTFTRKMLEEMTTPLVDRSLEILQRVMTDAGMTPDRCDELLLVGGQTRMPIVQKRLSAFFGKPPSKGVHPDEAVAIGAALYANSLEDNSNLRLQLLDVIPMAIGLERAGGEFHVVFPRNAAIPNAKAIEATTSYDGQTEVAMRIYQGDNPTVAHNELLGDFLFSGLRPGPAGTARLEITFQVSIEGILTMSSRDLDTGKQMKTTVRVTQH